MTTPRRRPTSKRGLPDTVPANSPAACGGVAYSTYRSIVALLTVAAMIAICYALHAAAPAANPRSTVTPRPVAAPTTAQATQPISRPGVVYCVTSGSLIAAVHAVENPRNVRTRHAAQGPLQIQPALVRDLNRHGYRFALADRYSYSKSAAMFAAYARLYHARSANEAARIWNQGPGGKHSRAAYRYAAKVKRNMK